MQLHATRILGPVEQTKKQMPHIVCIEVAYHTSQICLTTFGHMMQLVQEDTHKSHLNTPTQKKSHLNTPGRMVPLLRPKRKCDYACQEGRNEHAAINWQLVI